jgi:hypothetical protein
MTDQLEYRRAIEAVPADPLRDYLWTWLMSQDARVRRSFMDGLLGAAARQDPRFVPRVVADPYLEEDVAAWSGQDFKQNPSTADSVDSLLERVNRQYLAGEYVRVARLYGRLFWGVELWENAQPERGAGDELLNSALIRAAVRYLVAIVASSDVTRTADSLIRACEVVDGICMLVDPPRQMLEETPPVLLERLSTLDAPWQRLLEQSLHRMKEEGRRSAADAPELGWLTKSLLRTGVPDGLLRIARLSNDPVTWEEWIDVLLRQGRWSEVIESVSEALAGLGNSLVAARLADLAFAAACAVDGHDEQQRWAERALRSEPTVRRLLTAWQLARACPSRDSRAELLMLVLENPTHRPPARVEVVSYMLAGLWEEVAGILASADGLGWSSISHPGKIALPVLVDVVRQCAIALPDPGESLLPGTLRATPFVDQLCASLVANRLEDLDTSLLPRRPLPEPLRLVLPDVGLWDSIVCGLSEASPTETQLEVMLEGIHQAVLKRATGAVSQRRQRVYPEAVVAVFALVELFLLLGRHVEAQAVFRRAIQLSNDDPRWLSHWEQLVTPELLAAVSL